MSLKGIDPGKKVKALANELTLDNFDVVSQHMIAWVAMPKIKTLLESMTADNFDRVSDQVISWVKKVEIHHILPEFTATILEKANDESISALCARLCKEIKDNISPRVSGVNGREHEGNPIASDAQLFEDLTRTLYDAIHIKHKSRGFFMFIGELFKLNVLAESVIHAQVGSILYGARNEEDIEALCVLLTEVGKGLDVSNGNACMDSYCLRMRELMQDRSVGPQTVLSLQGVLDLRERNWESSSGQRTIPEVSQEVAVTVLLDSLTTENFESVSDEVILLCNRSEEEKDGRTLHKIIRATYDKATKNKDMAEMYARLCRKMMEQISPMVQDEGIKNSEGKSIGGGQLFRKYLLNHCKKYLKRAYYTSLIMDPESDTVARDFETDPLSEEEKLRCIGFVRFMCELFKLQMFSEEIMHQCAINLLLRYDSPREHFMEMVCEFFVAIGRILDTPKTRSHMDVYLSRMKELSSNQGLNPRVRSMLQDVADLRERKWVLEDGGAA